MANTWKPDGNPVELWGRVWRGDILYFGVVTPEVVMKDSIYPGEAIPFLRMTIPFDDSLSTVLPTIAWVSGLLITTEPKKEYRESLAVFVTTGAVSISTTIRRAHLLDQGYVVHFDMPAVHVVLPERSVDIDLLHEHIARLNLDNHALKIEIAKLEREVARLTAHVLET